MTPGLKSLAFVAAALFGNTADAAGLLGCLPHQFLLEGVVVEADGKFKVRIKSDTDSYALVKVYGPVKLGQRLLGCQARIDEVVRHDPEGYIITVPSHRTGAWDISLFRRGARRSAREAAEECLRQIETVLVDPAGERLAPEQIEASHVESFKRCFDVLTM